MLWSAVLFDGDGVIFDTEELSILAFRRAMETFGLHFTREGCQRYVGMGTKPILDSIAEERGQVIDLQEFLLRRDSLYELCCRQEQGPKAMPGMSDLLDWLDQQRIPFAVASAASRRKLHFNLEQTGLASRFPVAIDGDMVPMGKPDPAIFLRAAEALSIDPTRALVVEDSLNGLRAGLAAGAAVAAIRGTHPDAELLTLTEAIFDSPGTLLETLRSRPALIRSASPRA